MNPATTNPDDDESARWAIPEERYSLRTLLKEVEAERRTGAFSAERLRQNDISRLFETKPHPARGDSD